MNSREQNEKIWNNIFLFCKDYENNGHILTSEVEYQGYCIGSWLARQKGLYDKNIMCDQKKNKLQHLIYWRDWLNKRKLLWDNQLSLCIEYEKNGNTLSKSVIYKNKHIGSWLKRQNNKLLNNKLNQYQTNQMKKLSNKALNIF